MNIFFLSSCPGEAAKLQCDAHRLKMIVESTQVLYTALSLLKIPVHNVTCHTPEGDAFDTKPYRPTHKHHPSVLWVLGGRSHFEWLLSMALELCALYTAEFGKKHRSQYHLDALNERVNRDDLPVDVCVSGWLERLRDKDVSEQAIDSCGQRATTVSLPEGCFFGVRCIETNEPETGVNFNDIITNPDDLVQSYREFYAFKAKRMFCMRWDKRPDVPADLQAAFAGVLPDTPPMDSPPKRKRDDPPCEVPVSAPKLARQNAFNYDPFD